MKTGGGQERTATPVPRFGESSTTGALPHVPRFLMSQRAYARRRGVSHTAVQNAIATGALSTVGGRIDPDVADEEWSPKVRPAGGKGGRR